MNYFEIKTYTPRGGKGEFIKDYHYIGSVLSESFLGNLNPYAKIDIHPVIPTVEIGAGYSIPDILIPGGPISGRFILSSLLKKILDSYGAERLIQYFPIKIIQEGKSFNDYWITQFLSFDNSLLDFSKCVFTEKITIYESNGYVITKRTTQNHERTFESEEELSNRMDELYEEGNSISYKNLYIYDSCNLDIVLIEDNLCQGIIVSENLKSKLEQIDFKGIEFKPLKIPDEEWYGPNGLRKQFYN
ncbi:hypothetical protein [Algoriphagus marinus]|uniref:hypothetical protein n=1 Tax=Algoriphagus marinus TaxID=1925762 RepID=UPI00094BBD92|nr:hypothetical protein [Algoriphagus marinus]